MWKTLREYRHELESSMIPRNSRRPLYLVTWPDRSHSLHLPPQTSRGHCLLGRTDTMLARLRARPRGRYWNLGITGYHRVNNLAHLVPLFPRHAHDIWICELLPSLLVGGK